MGERTWGQLTVVELDAEKYPEEAEAILDALKAAGLAGTDEKLRIGHDALYEDDQVRCGFLMEYIDPLGSKAPHAVIDAIEGAHAEFLAERWMAVPGLGSHWGICDDAGRLLCTGDFVKELIIRARNGQSDEEFARLTGWVWESAMAEAYERSRRNLIAVPWQARISANEILELADELVSDLRNGEVRAALGGEWDGTFAGWKEAVVGFEDGHLILAGEIIVGRTTADTTN